jgi:oligoribonuclease NrnB/cAMP/cGMP phosphodiesterase (DHH superfamily)
MNTETIYVFHHDDADGFVSAAAVLASARYGQTIKFFAVQYSGQIPQIEFEPNSTLYILDFSYPKEVLLDLAGKVDFMLVIDHHETAEEQLSDFPRLYNSFQVEKRDHKLPFVIFDKHVCAATLAWEYFFHGVTIPYAVDLVSRYDVWDIADPKVLAFDIGMKSLGRTRDVAAWLEVIRDENGEVEKAIEIGMPLVEYNNAHIKDFKTSEKLKITEWEEFRVALYNTTHLKNELAHSLYTDMELSVDLTMGYSIISKAKILFSLRSQKGVNVNVGQLAKRYGGGGHCHAASFAMPLIEGAQFLDKLYKLEPHPLWPPEEKPTLELFQTLAMQVKEHPMLESCVVTSEDDFEQRWLPVDNYINGHNYTTQEFLFLLKRFYMCYHGLFISEVGQTTEAFYQAQKLGYKNKVEERDRFSPLCCSFIIPGTDFKIAYG